MPVAFAAALIFIGGLVSIPRAAYAAQINAASMVGHVNDLTGLPNYIGSGVSVNPRGLTSPIAVCVDTTDHFVFVSDDMRVLVFKLNSDNTIATVTPSYVLGQADFFAPDPNLTRKGFSGNNGLACDSVGSRLFVSDSNNNRVLVFNVAAATIQNNEDADYVLGQSDFVSQNIGTTQNGLNGPAGLAYDATSKRLFVADSGNSRVLVFDVRTAASPSETLCSNASTGIANNMNASCVEGQADFISGGTGTTATTLSFANDVAYDPNAQRIFVADTGNNRVLVFSAATSSMTSGETATNVLGQTSTTGSSSGTSIATLSSPTGTSYDSAANRLFVEDHNNNRVLVYNVATSTIPANNESASNVLGQTLFTTKTKAVSQSGLYLAGGSVFYDTTTKLLYVMDSGNYRVMIFSAATSTIANGENATWNLGHATPTGTPQYTAWVTTNWPLPQSAYNTNGAILDTTNHRLFVVDFNDAGVNPITGITVPSARILVYPLDSNNHISSLTATNVLGWPDFYGGVAKTVTQKTFNIHLSGGTYDAATGRLFISDTNNNRVLVFDARPSGSASETLCGNSSTGIADNMNASCVLGQSLFTTATAADTQSGMNAPRGTAYDSVGKRLFVADTGNNRVLIFDAATSTMTSGENALNELGQASGAGAFTTNTAATTQGGLNSPQANLAYDSTSNRLFVPDVNNNRVMVFNVATSTIANGMNATNVLGEPNFTTVATSTTASGLTLRNSQEFGGGGGAVTYDPVWGRLFVADSGNYRVMIFDAATSTITNGEAAENVLGSTSFTVAGALNHLQNGPGISESGDYNSSQNCYFDDQWMPDRVMEFCMIHITTASLPGGSAGSAYSQTISITQQQGTSQSFSLYNGSLPGGLSLASSTGVISGTPTQAGTFSFTVEADDTFSTGALFDRASFSVSVSGTNPTVTTNAATSVTATSATVNGAITATGGSDATDSGFAIGTSSSLATGVSTSTLGAQSGAASFSLSTTTLSVGTTYYFRAYATNGIATAYGSIQSFTTSATPPSVTEQSATSITQTSATLNGTVTSTGGATVTVAGFNYGLTSGYGQTASSTGTFTSTFSQSISGLACNTTYHYEAVATNSSGTANSSDATFATSVCAPTVTTRSPTSVATSTATFNGNISATGGASATTRGFAYGATTSYGATTTESGTFSTGTYTFAATGLTPHTTYHIAAYAINSGGTAYGNDTTFTTSTLSSPTVTAQAASSLTPTGATLNGTLTAIGDAAVTIEGFNYGLTTGYGSTASSTSASFGLGAFAQSITGLSCNTTYHYEASAGSSVGTSTSADQSFTTGACAPSVTTSAASSVSTSTATLNGSISATGGADATQSGFAYGTDSALVSVIATSTLGTQSGTASFTKNLIGLAANTTYYARAYATNSSGTGLGGIVSFSTTDTTPPSVSLTAPSIGATVSGSSVALAASASDDVGVAGVQFKLDSNTLVGAEDTSAPYTVNWDSTGVADGSHTFIAVARDTSGNYATSTAVSVTVNNNSPAISSISSGTPSSSGATITWTTDLSTNSQLRYGLTTTYGATSSLDSALATSHSVSISGLVSCSVYHYQALSGLSTSPDATLTTGGCTGSASIQSSQPTTIATSTGGTVTLGAITLSVPTSFSSTTPALTFQAVSLESAAFFASANTPSGLSAVGTAVFNLKAFITPTTTTTSFDSPLTVTLTYSPGEITGIDPTSLVIYRYDSGTWTALSGCSTDANAHTVSCQTSHFSDFALFGSPAPSVSSSAPAVGNGPPVGTVSSLTAPAIALPAPSAVSAASSTPALATPSTCSTYLTGYIKRGSPSNDPEQVKRLQRFLYTYENEFGLTMSGVYDLNTMQALMRFQSKYASDILTPWNLSAPTGYVYTTTSAKVNKVICAGLATSSAAARVVAIQTTKTTAARRFAVVLFFGKSGSDVSRLQRFLASQGFLAQGSVSGYFGLLTAAALERFQVVHKITGPGKQGYGVFGPATRDVVNSMLP